MSAATQPSKHPSQLGLERLNQQNKACEHAVDVGASERKHIRLSLRYPEADCPWCLRRLWLYWRGRAKAAEGQVRAPTDDAREMLEEIVAWHGICPDERCWCSRAKALLP